MKIYIMIGLVILFCVLSDSLAYNDGGCEFSSLTSEDWRIGKRWYPQLQNETFSYILPYTGNIDVLEKSCEFLTLEKSHKGLIINNSPDLEELDMMIPPSPSFEATCVLILSCKNGNSTLDLIQPIIDVNNYAPVFHNDSYEILLPKYVPPGQDLVKYLDVPIQVEDLDFSNYNVSFEIEPNDFHVNTRLIEDRYRRIYIPVIETKQAMNVTQGLTYFLTATDTGNIPHSLSSTIKITLRQRSSDDENYGLYFQKNIYKFIYKSYERNGATLITYDVIRLITQQQEEEDVIIYLDGNKQIESYLRTSYSDETGKVDVILKQPLPPFLLKQKSWIDIPICARSSVSFIKTCSILRIIIQNS